MSSAWRATQLPLPGLSSGRDVALLLLLVFVTIFVLAVFVLAILLAPFNLLFTLRSNPGESGPPPPDRLVHQSASHLCHAQQGDDDYEEGGIPK